MKTSEVRSRWGKVVAAVHDGGKRILVEKSGVPVAAVVSANDLARLQRFEAERSKRFAALDRIGEAFKDVPLEKLEAEVAKAIAEVRDENRRLRASGR
jgi:prevent-host-death family protein